MLILKKLMFALDASLVAQTVKSLPAMQEAPGSNPGSGRFPGKEMATPSSILAWKNPMDRGAWWALQPMGSLRVRQFSALKSFALTMFALKSSPVLENEIVLKIYDGKQQSPSFFFISV